MKKVEVSIRDGHDNASLGEFIGDDLYKGIFITAKSKIVPSHINNHNGSDYLDTIHVEITDDNAVGVNLFEISTCDNGKILELHIATGIYLKDFRYTNSYNSRKELLLFSDKGEEIQINFIVYEFDKEKPLDLFIHKCGANTRTKISEYNEFRNFQNLLSKNNWLTKNGDPIPTHTPKVRKGNILIGRQP